MASARRCSAPSPSPRRSTAPGTLPCRCRCTRARTACPWACSLSDATAPKPRSSSLPGNWSGRGRGRIAGRRSTDSGKAMPLDYAKLKNRVFPTLTQRYTARDTILYALGVGVGLEDPLDPDELRFVYEEGLRALPTMAVGLANEGLWPRDPHYGGHLKQLV